MHLPVTDDQEEAQQQGRKSYQCLKDVVLLFLEKKPFHRPPKPAKIKQGNPSTQYQSPGNGPALKPQACEQEESQDLGAAFLDGDQLVDFLPSDCPREITFSGLFCQQLSSGKKGCGMRRQYPELKK